MQGVIPATAPGELLDSSIDAPVAAHARVRRLLRVGLLTAALLVVTFFEFELDRFFVPKELVLHISAFSATLLLFGILSRAMLDRTDVLLVLFVILSGISAALAANVWIASRAVALTASSVALYWVGREMRRAGEGRPLLVALGLAVAVACIAALAQAYGVETDLFSVNRAPGGTLGNRNSVAHLAAIGFPLMLLCALRAWRPAGYLMGALGVLLVTGSLVMTRSRAGWLAFAAAAFIFLAAMVVSGALRRHRRAWWRLLGLVPFAVAGGIAAVYIPNTLEWRSENPYLESVQGIANYQEGSGRGRLVQYRQSVSMAVDQPLLGVGPGNWPVRYPEYATRGDPSLDQSAPGTTSNPWPSSDWVAFLSERGLAATLLLLLALARMAVGGIRATLAPRDPDEGLQAAALVSILAAAVVAGLFDAVLLLGLPAFIVWLALGLLAPPGLSRPTTWGGGAMKASLVLILIGSAVGVVRSTGQLTSMAAFTWSDDTTWLRRAATMDPGNYRLQLRLAGPSGGLQRGLRCDHALAAEALFPNARAARNLADGCD